MKLTQEAVKKIARLARLKLTKEELGKFSVQLGGILEYVDILNEVDTTGVKATYQVTGLENISDSDEIKRCENPEELLSCSGLPIVRNQIKVKSVF